MTNEKTGLLIDMLKLAVPMWQQKIKANPDYYEDNFKDLTEKVCYEGESLLWKDKNTAMAFNNFALAVAILSFSPNGVSIFGVKFQFE